MKLGVAYQAFVIQMLDVFVEWNVTTMFKIFFGKSGRDSRDCRRPEQADHDQNCLEEKHKKLSYQMYLIYNLKVLNLLHWVVYLLFIAVHLEGKIPIQNALQWISFYYA